jgi:hypothetical protein
MRASSFGFRRHLYNPVDYTIPADLTAKDESVSTSRPRHRVGEAENAPVRFRLSKTAIATSCIPRTMTFRSTVPPQINYYGGNGE